MSKLTFYGRVYPEIVEISVGAIGVKWEIPEIGQSADFLVSITGSKVEVNCQTDNFEHDNLVHYYKRVIDLSRALTDLVAFKMAWALTVMIDRYVMEDGTERKILLNDPRLPELVASYGIDDIKDVAPMVISEPEIFMALNDLIGAITLPHHAVVNCARAVEGIRHLVAGQDVEPRKGWPLMRQVLNVDEAFVSLVTGTSAKPRHGDRTFIPGGLTGEVTRRAWKVMDRFIEFRRRGSRPLPLDQFPLLKG